MTTQHTGAHRIHSRNAHSMLRVPALPHPGEPRHAADPDRIADLLHRTLPMRAVASSLRNRR